MTLVGCDLHSRTQQVAVLDPETGEVQERRLAHDGDAVEQFYAFLPRPVTVGIESTGYALWFHALLQRQGHTLLVGDAAKIRAMVVRKTKTDRRDAAHLRQLLKENRFPVIWVPDPTVRDLRALVAHRMRLVRMRTMVKNGLHAIALNHRLAAGSTLFTRRGRAQLEALALPPYTTQRRDESLELLTWLDTHVHSLEARIAQAADADPRARQLMTHPGVGALTALATVLVLGPVDSSDQRDVPPPVPQHLRAGRTPLEREDGGREKADGRSSCPYPRRSAAGEHRSATRNRRLSSPAKRVWSKASRPLVRATNMGGAPVIMMAPLGCGSASTNFRRTCAQPRRPARRSSS